MIIPVRCLACGKVLADKWEAYERRCKALRGDEDDATTTRDGKNVPGKKTQRGIILDELEITSVCCRAIMLTNVDMSTII
jgi:DNA-directed RNA polymerase subunit N (RpoN/RPB10)